MHQINWNLGLAIFAALLAFDASAADTSRQAEVARLGADVMPFSLAATTHAFIKTADGGLEQVVAKKRADTEQVRLVREHLRAIRQQFLQGDFSGPERVHGRDMPGLETLRSAKPGRIKIGYEVIDGGAQVTYRTGDAVLVRALHQWFDAQLSDHGADATAEHHHHHPEEQKL